MALRASSESSSSNCLVVKTRSVKRHLFPRTKIRSLQVNSLSSSRSSRPINPLTMTRAPPLEKVTLRTPRSRSSSSMKRPSDSLALPETLRRSPVRTTTKLSPSECLYKSLATVASFDFEDPSRDQIQEPMALIPENRVFVNPVIPVFSPKNPLIIRLTAVPAPPSFFLALFFRLTAVSLNPLLGLLVCVLLQQQVLSQLTYVILL